MVSQCNQASRGALCKQGKWREREMEGKGKQAILLSHVLNVGHLLLWLQLTSADCGLIPNALVPVLPARGGELFVIFHM